jgi:hypothetical protein
MPEGMFLETAKIRSTTFQECGPTTFTDLIVDHHPRRLGQVVLRVKKRGGVKTSLRSRRDGLFLVLSREEVKKGDLL